MTDRPSTAPRTHPTLADWCRRLPKVELHLHLEGAIPISALWDLVQKYGGDSRVRDEAALRELFRFRDFPHFLGMWVWKNGFLREYEDFTFFSAAVADALKLENVRYAEAFISPGRFKPAGLATGPMIEAIRAGLDSVSGVEVALIADLVRDLGPESAAVVLDEVSELRSLGVIGVGMGGAEHLYPPGMYRDVFLRAKAMGFRTTAHAGEAAGPESVWGAIRALQVDRIGHGTRAGEDPALVQHLAESQLPIEMCPLSNVATGVVESVAAHPIRDFFDRGLMVTVNSDDPAMFGHSLSQDYEALMGDLSFSPDEVRTLILNGIRSSWLSPDRKADMESAFISDPAWSFAPSPGDA